MTEQNDDFFERLRGDARPLRYQASDVELARIRARILATIERPTVTDMLAAWFRPVIATVAMIAALAVFTLTELRNEEPSYEQVEIVVAGDAYVVGN
jgi:hypothetical protein